VRGTRGTRRIALIRASDNSPSCELIYELAHSISVENSTIRIITESSHLMHGTVRIVDTVDARDLQNCRYG
jgi:hypothetical protein